MPHVESQLPQPDALKTRGKHLLLYVLLAFASIASFAMGWAIFSTDPRLSTVLTSLGIAFGPVAILGMIYGWFLFDEIREGARTAFAGEMCGYVDPLIDRLQEQYQELIDNTFILSQIHKLGVVAAFEQRRNAFGLLKDHMAHEQSEIFLVGTSLRGLLDPDVGDRDFQGILERKFKESQQSNSTLRVRVLMTHPAFAYLRQKLEKHHSRREDFSIAKEIYDSVLQLRKLGARPDQIQFVKGTPTCFAVKTSKRMLINPYPYEDQSLGSFCVVVSNQPDRDGIYKSFVRSHFIWDSPNTVPLPAFTVSGMQEVFSQTLQTLMPSPDPIQVRDEHLLLEGTGVG